MENMTLDIFEVPFKQAVMYILASFPVFEKESDSSCWCREPEAVRQLCSTNLSKGVSLAARIRCKLTYTDCLSSAMICISLLGIGVKNVIAAIHYKIGSVD